MDKECRCIPKCAHDMSIQIDCFILVGELNLVTFHMEETRTAAQLSRMEEDGKNWINKGDRPATRVCESSTVV